jgi:hypothetical protein
MVLPRRSLGAFVSDLMGQKQHTNVSLAAAAGVSEGVIRNILKVGIDPKAKDPEARTLRRVADALEVDALKLFRLAGYLPPPRDANSVRADYLAEVFDELPPEKQDAVMGVLEAMARELRHKEAIRKMRETPDDPTAGIDILTPGMIRLIANQLIVHYEMLRPEDVYLIKPDVFTTFYRWKDLSTAMQERVKALIRQKLSLEYDPTMVDPEWRD